MNGQADGQTIDVPAVRRLGSVNPSYTSFMRHFGATTPVGIASAWAPLETLSPLLVSAAVKSEDPRFFRHRGVDWLTSALVGLSSIRARRIVGGASTITQQLSRNLYLTPSRSVVRKLREIGLALRLERRLSKARILELYLNLVEWGGGTWGCVAASEHYFQKSPADLDLFESTFLVSLLPAPKLGLSGRHAERSRQRQFRVANLMLLSGLADPERCAACVQRMRSLHELVARGLPLLSALAASRRATSGTDAPFLRDLIGFLGVEPLAPAGILTSRCGYDQQQRAIQHLETRFGAGALRMALATSRYDLLRQALRLFRTRETSPQRADIVRLP